MDSVNLKKNFDKKNILKRVEVETTSKELLSDIKEFSNVLIEELDEIKRIYYKTKDGILIKFPYTVLVSTMVPNKGYESKLFTLMRYSIYSELKQEYNEHCILLTEISERLEKAKEIWDTLDEHKKITAELLIKQLNLIQTHLKYGFCITDSMISFMNGEPSSLDHNNPYANEIKKLI